MRKSVFSLLLAVALTILCVGEAQPLWGASDSESFADLIVKSSGFSGGICVVIGDKDASLALSIGRHGPFVVQTLYTDKSTLNEARNAINSSDIYGKVSADVFSPDHLPYVENLIDILIADNFPELMEKGLSIREVLRVLAPLGAAYLGGGDIADTAKSQWIEKVKANLAAEGIISPRIIEHQGVWIVVRKPWPPDIDEWTHYLHGPDGNPVANDKVVGPPKHYQWITGPLWFRSHDTDSSVTAIVTARGRIFYLVDEAPISLTGDHPLPDKWFLVARDAFNGVLLWQVPIKRWGWREWKDTWYERRPWNMPLNLPRRIVAVNDSVFVTLGYHAPVTRLDARTGKVIQVYEGTEDTREILYCKGILILSVFRDSRLKLMAVDAQTGKTLWETMKSYSGSKMEYITFVRGKHPPVDPVLNPAADGNAVCFVDGSSIVCLDFKTGEERWRTRVEDKGNGLWIGTLILHDKIVLYASPEKLMAFSAGSGEKLWERPKHPLTWLWFQWKDVFVIDDLVWTWGPECKRERVHVGNRSYNEIWPLYLNGYDLSTGKLVKRVDLHNIFKAPHHHRCYRNKATVRYVIASRRGSEFIDLRRGQHSVNNWVRGACHYGMVPANGFLYAPTHPCICYINEKLNGFNALAPEIPEKYKANKTDSTSRFERGPAYGSTSGPGADSDDWPSFRHDPLFSGCAGTKLSAKLNPIWSVSVGRKITPVTVAAGMVFASDVEGYTVFVLDARSGRKRWRFITGGRVDSPPTYYRGRVLFGCADGWVYCLRVSDGQLVWRYRAAPEDRRMCAFDRIESVWPVHGSVLVQNGVVYFAAGRSSHLDGGIYLYGLDALSGELLCKTCIEGPDMDMEHFVDNLNPPQGALVDLLQGDGRYVYMRNLVFDSNLKLVSKSGRPPAGREDAKGPSQTAAAFRLRTSGGFLDDSYFKRAPWYIGTKRNWGRVIVHDGRCYYAMRMFTSLHCLDPRNFFTPGHANYILLAHDLSGAKRPRWSEHIPIRVRAMLIADGKLFIAGPPDIVDPEDPFAAFEGRKGALLWVIDADSGEKLREYKLNSPPVFNGMAAAAGRLYLSTLDGKVACFE